MGCGGGGGDGGVVVGGGGVNVVVVVVAVVVVVGGGGVVVSIVAGGGGGGGGGDGDGDGGGGGVNRRLVDGGNFNSEKNNSELNAYHPCSIYENPSMAPMKICGNFSPFFVFVVVVRLSLCSKSSLSDKIAILSAEPKSHITMVLIY